MSQERWNAVDDYIASHLVGDDPVLDAAVAASEAAGLPAIQVAANQGKLLYLLAKATGARKILEIGTLGGYSAIWFGRAVGPEGRVITLEANPDFATVAQANIQRAGLGDVVDIRVGPGLDTLPGLGDEAPFDLTFIDANKEDTPEYFDHALRLSRVGSLIIVDNVVRGGALVDEADTDDAVVGMRRYVERASTEPRVDTTAIQVVGVKGYDGLSVSLVVA